MILKRFERESDRGLYDQCVTYYCLVTSWGLHDFLLSKTADKI